jgi:hypothetical protein
MPVLVLPAAPPLDALDPAPPFPPLAAGLPALPVVPADVAGGVVAPVAALPVVVGKVPDVVLESSLQPV